jgi:hypothetical protein
MLFVRIRFAVLLGSDEVSPGLPNLLPRLVPSRTYGERAMGVTPISILDYFSIDRTSGQPD